MYSPEAVERSVARIRDSTGVTLTSHPVEHSLGMAEQLAALSKSDGSLTRALTPDERTFIRNERWLSRVSYDYWTRYSKLLLDGGGLGRLDLWESQRLTIAFIAQLERENLDRQSRGEPCDGICVVIHKDRQMGLTALVRSLVIHRLTTTQHLRGIAASVDEDKKYELYDRDKRIYDNLPWYLQPHIAYDEKAEHTSYAPPLDSSILYQHAQQRSGTGTGLGTGRQFDLGHLTECSHWPNPSAIEFDYFPTIPLAPYALHILESTANGRGNWWHDFVNRTRTRRVARWRFLFIPWYAEPRKYRRTPPSGWRPSESSLTYAMKVYDTSPEYVGKHVQLPRENLYWYETERAGSVAGGTLPIFLSNYACVSGDTRVSTESGIVRIDTASDAQRVETGAITHWFDRGERDVVLLETAWGRRLTLTPDHVVRLVDGQERPVAALHVGDALVLSPPQLSVQPFTVRWNTFPTHENRVVIDEAWGRFLGYFMGDGCFHDDTVTIVCTAKDDDVIEDVSCLMQAVTGKRPARYGHVYKGRVSGVDVRVSSVHWKPVLRAMGVIRSRSYGGHTRNMEVPRCILQSPISVVRQFLSGLFEADGHAYPYWARTSFSSAYFDFVKDVQLLLLAFGLNSKLRFDSAISSRAGGEKKYSAWLLAMGAAASDEFHKRVGFVSHRKRSACVGVGGRLDRKPDRRRRPNALVDTVRSVASLGRSRVYDLEVGGTHHYGANGILVHNCTVEESFQHSLGTQAAFPAEMLEAMRNRVHSKGQAMEVVSAS